MAISVGSVEVDVVPNTRGIYQRLRDGIVPAATRAGEEAGQAAGRAFGPAMQGQVGDLGLRVGEQIGQQVANRIAAAVRDSLREGITRAGQEARPAAIRQGDEAGGAFSRALKTRLEAAFRSLPHLQIGADTSEADADLQALRVRMQALADRRIGIDISAEDAKAEIHLIQAELTRLGAEHPNIQVRADTAAAQAQLAAVLAAIEAVDARSPDVRVDVDISGAMAALVQLSVALAAVGAIPAIPIAAAGLGALAASATAAGVGVGALAAVAIPALSGIRNALEAQKAAQNAATVANEAGGQAASQAASKALQLAGAQQALATAERNGARQIAQAQAQVVQARQAAADAVQQAAQRNGQASRAVQDAEKQLTAAQKDARRAQVDLTEARKQAAQELEDLANRYIDSQLSQRDAALSLQQAQLELQRTIADPKASELQRAQAQLAYDQAVQRLREQTTETKRLKDQQAAAAKSGVEGSKTVQQAQERLAQAQQQVADRAQAVRDAQAEAARVQVQTSRQVAEAQRRVSEATRNVAVAQQNAADAVASAQRQIQSAQLSTASSVSKAATAQDKYQAALAKLSPAARETYQAFINLRGAFTTWSASLQPAVLPLFTRALDGVRNSLPGLTPIVLAAARAVGVLQDKVSAGFKTPWWKSFKQDMAASVEPSIVGLGVSFGHIFQGMAGVIQAFLPHLDDISNRAERVTGKFADWGTRLKGSPAFEKFLAYMAQQAPILGETLGKLGGGLLDVGRALSPLSGPVLKAVGLLADDIGWLAQNLPGVFQGVYVLFLTTKAWALAQLGVNAGMRAYQGLVIFATLLTDGWAAAIAAASVAFDANPIFVVVSLVLGALALLVAGVIYAWNHWAWFRDAVLAVWSAIQSAALWAWTNVLQPVFSALAGAARAVGTAAVWLWQNAIQPAFEAISLLARTLLAVVVVAVLTPIYLAIKLVGAIAMWLWTNVIQPAFEGIAAVAIWLWQNAILPAANGIGGLLRGLANTALWLWRNALQPAFEGIASVAEWLWRNAIAPAFHGISDVVGSVWRDGIRPAFGAIRSGISAVADSFDVGVGYIGSIWDTIRDKTRRPVQWVIDVVYNNGIRAIWNKVADFLDLGHLDVVRYAGGGTVPGYAPRQDIVPALLSPGEGVLVPETVRALGGAPAIAALNAWGRGGMPQYAAGGIVQHFDFGGIVSDLWDSAKSGVKTIGGWAGDAWDLVTHPKDIWTKAIAPVLSKIDQVGHSRWAQAIGKIPRKMIEGLEAKLVNSVKDVFGGIGDFLTGGGGGGGVTRWTGVVQQALRLLGQPLEYTGITLRRMEQESGGNPAIVNKWDSNWIAGTPSVGLMQVIGPTFDAYAGPFRNTGPFLYGVSVNPLANVVASMRYALAAYGSLPAAYNRAGGYDSGGYLQPGLNLAYNGTGRPEPVFTTQQANALMRLAGDPGAGVGDLRVQIYVGDREITDIARAEVRRSNGELVQTLLAGRR